MATIDNLVIEIEGNATQASGGIDKLKASLEGLRTATSNFRLGSFVSSLENLKKSMTGIDGNAAQSLNLMTDALSKLHVLDGVKISTSIASQLRSIGEVTRDLGGVDWSQIKVMADSLAPLAGIQKSNGLNNTVNALRKMPEAIKGINNLNPEIIAEFTERVEQLRVAIHPLADEMRAVSAGFSALPANIQKAIKANQKLTSSTEKTTRSFGSLLSRVVSVGAAYYGFRKLFSFAMDAFEASNNFIESLNLAEVAMGEGSKAAVEYAEKVERLAGIDMSKWLTQVGSFNQQLEGFGIPAEKANQMAQMLTQLGYDIQSVFNLSDVNTAMERLSSGISGQIKGMRSYGVELSVAAMQEFALQHGITQTWSSMSQAQKVALRYAKIMESTTNIQGDLARTIITPANSLRILQSQFGIAARYIGQIVSVIAAKVIPVFSAIAQVIGMAAKAIAAFFGFTLPDISASVGKDWGGAVGGAEDLEDAIGGAGGAAKEAKEEIKGMLADWDEINIIQQKNESPAGTGGGGGGGSIGDIGDLIDIGDYAYDFLKGIQNDVDELIAKIRSWMPEILAFLGAIAAYGILSNIEKIASLLGASATTLAGIRSIVAGISFAIVGIVMSWDGIYNIINGEGFTPENIFKAVGGFIADTLGFAMIGNGIGKISGLQVNGFMFGIGMAFAVDGLAVTYAAVDNMVAHGINTKNILEAVGGAIATGLGVGVASVALGASMPISIALGAIAAVTVGIGAVTLYQEKKATELAKEAFAASGEGGFTPEEVIEALQTEFTERTKGAQLVIDAFNGVDSFKTKLKTASDSITELNEAVFGEGKPTAEDINVLKEAWASFDSALTDLSGASFDTMFTALNQMIDSEYGYLKERAAEYQKQLIMMQQGITERQAERQIDRNEILDKIGLGTATEEEIARYRAYSTFDAEMMKGADQRRWDEIKAGGFLVDFSSDNGLDEAKTYIKDVADTYNSLVKVNEDAHKALEESQQYPRQELLAELNAGLIDKSYYDNQMSVLDGILTDYRDFTSKEIEKAQTDLGTVYGSLLQQMFENPAIDSMDPTVFRKYMQDQVGPLVDAIKNTGIENDVVSAYTSFYDSLMEQYRNTTGESIVNALFGTPTSGKQFTDQTALDWFNENVPQLPAIDTDTLYKPSLTQAETDALTTKGNIETNLKTAAAAPDLTNFNAGLDTMVKNAQTAADSVNDALASAGVSRKSGGVFGKIKDFLFGTGEVSLAPDIPRFTIPAYAGGGFPAQGQLFIANEQGPELVGRMGSAPAVANNDQIISGITEGVSRGQEEQNRLLREQNDLLRRMLAKDNSVVLRPSAEMGRLNQRSYELFKEVRG